MKTTLALITVCVLASSHCLAEGFHIGPHAGHQNLKAHFKSSDSETSGLEYNPETRQFELVTTSEQEGASTASYNTNVQGVNMGYDFGRFSLISSLDVARYFPASNARYDLTRLTVGGQYDVLQLGRARIHAGAGVSYGRLALKVKTESFNSEEDGLALDVHFEADPVTIVNYDLSLGTSVALMDKLDLVVDYHYSDAIKTSTARIRGGVQGNFNGTPLHADMVGTSKKGTFTTQEMTLGLQWTI